MDVLRLLERGADHAPKGGHKIATLNSNSRIAAQGIPRERRVWRTMKSCMVHNLSRTPHIASHFLQVNIINSTAQGFKSSMSQHFKKPA